ncbi:MAG: helix-turn-helix transcriptional regulator [Phycisphaerales bacterium]|nr:helix-turn-helix transcriptional regulator [Phycisphaerales bacterium]
MAKKRPSLQRDFGARVRELRLRANLKQRELAERCGKGFAMQRVGQIERGEMNCTLATIAALCRGLRCDPIELFLFPGISTLTDISLEDARLRGPVALRIRPAGRSCCECSGIALKHPSAQAWRILFAAIPQ